MPRPTTRLVTRSSARRWRAGNRRSDARLPVLCGDFGEHCHHDAEGEVQREQPRRHPEQRVRVIGIGDHFTRYLKQAVVLFPLVEKAGAFFDASAQQWPACRQYTHTQSESQWSVGQISNANGTLSTTATQQNPSAPGWGCGRALALRNNVIIDINTCSANPADSALKIADHIPANAPAR